MVDLVKETNGTCGYDYLVIGIFKTGSVMDDVWGMCEFMIKNILSAMKLVLNVHQTSTKHFADVIKRLRKS